MVQFLIGVYWFKRFWIRPATPRHQPFSVVSLQHAIMDDDVEVAPIYRCRDKVGKPERPCRSHDLHLEQETERLGVTVSKLLCQKELLYLDLDHWPVMAKSWECCSTNGLL